jgi:4-aminobutyrate aminotransferase-like enzyme
VNAVQPDAIRLTPPLILTEADVDAAVPILQAALDEVGR